jgi:hypothetical protein
MLFQVVPIQPSERWTCAMRNPSIWPLKIGDAADVPSDAERVRIQVQGQRIAHLRDARAVEIEALAVGAGILVVGADDVAPGPVPERSRDVVLQPAVGSKHHRGPGSRTAPDDFCSR